jgi:hypothetical protein
MSLFLGLFNFSSSRAEIAQLALQWAVGWISKEWGFSTHQGQEVFLFTTASRLSPQSTV